MMTGISKRWRERAVLARNFLLDGLMAVSPRAGRRQGEKTDVLLVRLDVIGDFVLWLDAAAGLRQLYPPDRYRLVLLGNALWTEFALGQPCFDEVIPVNLGRFHKEARYRFGLWRRLRAKFWETAINPTCSRHFPYDDAVMRVCGAGERIGSEGDLGNQREWEMRISNRWYTRLIPAALRPMMELERNAEFLRGLGAAQFAPGLPQLALPAAGLEPVQERYYLVVPGAGRPLRQWPLENFAAVMERIWDLYRLKAVICGAPGEEGIGRQLRSLVRNGAEVEDRTGGTTLTGFAAVIRDAVMVLGNESSAIHIAAAVGTRSICLVGGGHHGRFVPYRIEGEAKVALPVTVEHRMACYHCNWDCIYPCHGAAPCLEQITIDQVWRETKELLA